MTPDYFIDLPDEILVEDEVEFEPQPPTFYPLAVLDILGWKFTASRDQLLLETAPINGTPGLIYFQRGTMELLRLLLDLALDEPDFVAEEDSLWADRLIADGSLGVAK